MAKGSLIGGVGLGAGLMYFLDPDRGRRRRALLRDRGVSLVGQSEWMMSKVGRDLRNRSYGLAAETRSLFEHEEASPDVLEARIRSRLGRLCRHPAAISVLVREGGEVVLSGPILASDVDRVMRGVTSTAGVSTVENRLEVHQRAENVPGLQGGAARGPRQRFEFLQSNWSPGPRVLAGSAGCALALAGFRRGGILGALAGAAGTALCARALANTDFQRILGITGGHRAIEIQKTIHIHAPAERVFEFWTNYRNFARVMSHVHDVRDLGNGRSHWIVIGPAGMRLEWDAEITQFLPNQVLAWKSVPGSVVENAGIIRFDATPEGGCRITVRLSYCPPAGAIGHAIASLFGSDPKQAMDDDLVRLKSLLEHGKTTAHGETVFEDELVGQ